MPKKSAQKSGWKSAQSKNKVKQKTKLALLVLGLIILLLVFAQIFRVIKTLNSSWQMDSKKSYAWDGKFNINLIVKAKQISFISYSPTDQKITIVDIPDSAYVDAGSFGKWQVRALYDLGGDKLLKSSMRDFFAQPVDGFLDFSDKYKDDSGKQIVELIRSNPFGVLNILSHLKTDLTLMELIRLKLGFSSVRFDKVTSVNLTNLGVLEKGSLADRTEILTADPNKLDLVLVSLSDPVLKQDHKTVAVYNGAGKPLFAQKWARVISNMGADVIITANAAQTNKTVVVGEQSDTLKRLKQVFSYKCSSDCDKIQKSDEDLSSSRAEVNVKLGSDLD